jgi:hypothetical protein
MRWPVLLIGVVLLVGVTVFAMSYGSPTQSSIATSTDEIMAGSPTATHQDRDLGFLIKYPVSAQSATSTSAQYLKGAEKLVASFTLPASVEEGTNLIEAGVYVGVATITKATAACLEPGETEKAVSTRLLHDSIFKVFTSTGAAAGNIYETTSYRTIRNGNCFEIIAVIHYGNIGSYPPGQVEQFDVKNVSSILDRMVESFRFTKRQGSGVEGRVQVRCLTDASDMACSPQVRIIQAYQGPSSVGLFKTKPDGTFRGDLPPGQYELRVDSATSTRCVSIGIVVQENSYIATNLLCEVGTQ